MVKIKFNASIDGIEYAFKEKHNKKLTRADFLDAYEKYLKILVK